jgi:hypothetical protein
MFSDASAEFEQGESSMKQWCALALAAVLVFAATGCGDTKQINGTVYETYGLFNKDEVRDPNVYYEIITGNVVWGIILSKTIVAPIYFFGFSLYEPIGPKHPGGTAEK